MKINRCRGRLRDFFFFFRSEKESGKKRSEESSRIKRQAEVMLSVSMRRLILIGISRIGHD